MTRSFALLLAALLALAGTVMVRASSLSAIAVNDAAITGDAPPRQLSEYRFFADMGAQQPIPHVRPYRLNMPLYSDGAEKLRFVYMPQGTRLAAAGAGEGGGLLEFPVGSALIKTFAFGEGDKRRLIETRVLLHRADGWLALPYRWNDEQTDATLALAGARIDLTVPTGEAISYRIPNKNQCKECHGLNGEVTPIGPKARNLSSEWLAMMGLVADGGGVMPMWEGRRNADLAMAARAYLDVNCAHCHRPGAAASNSGLDLRWEQADPVKLGILKRPVAAGRGSGGLEFDIVPGDPARSILTYRMSGLEPGIAMPELGKSTVDTEGLALVERWISGMEQP